MTRTASGANGSSHRDARVLKNLHIAAVAACLFDPAAALALLDVPDAELGRLLKIRLMEIAGLSTALNIDVHSIRGRNRSKSSRKTRSSIRGAVERHVLVAAGKLLRTSNFLAASGATEQKLSKDVAARRIFTVDLEGEPYYPAFFLVKQLSSKDLAKVVRRLDDQSGWSKWEFFTSPNALLDHRTPLQGLMQKEVKPVLRAADALVQKG